MKVGIEVVYFSHQAVEAHLTPAIARTPRDHKVIQIRWTMKIMMLLSCLK